MGLLTCPRQQILIVLLLLFSSASSFSQLTEGISGITGDGRYSEELYVRTDRDIYIVGEAVYLKVFCFSNLTHNTSGISDVPYWSPSTDQTTLFFRQRFVSMASQDQGILLYLT